MPRINAPVKPSDAPPPVDPALLDDATETPTEADALFGDDPFGGALTSLFSSPRREALPDLSTVPRMVTDYFSSKGYRVTLASGSEASTLVLSTHQRHPLSLEMIKMPEIREQVKFALINHGFRIDQAGFPWRGDCKLFVQSEGARDAQLARGMALYGHQDDPASLDEGLTEINARFNASGLNRTYTQRTDVSRLQDHVTRWQEE